MKYPAGQGCDACSAGGTFQDGPGGAMKIFHSRKQFLVFFMPGFLLGIVYVNFIARKYMAEPGIFSDFFLNQFQSVSIDAKEYIWYLLRLRAVPFLALAGLSLTKAGKVSAVLFLVWTGISAGILISAAVIIYYDFSMLFVILLVAPIILIGSRIFLGKMYKSNMKQRQIASDVMSLYKESFQHLQSIKSFGLLQYFEEKMNTRQAARQEIDLEVNKYSIASWSVMYVSGQIAAVICLGWAVFHVYQEKISLGTMTLLIALAGTIASSFKSFIQLIPTAVATISSAERIRTITNLPEEVIERAEEYDVMYRRSMEKGICLKISHMNFHYKNGKQVFDNVTCQVKTGEIVAFVGPSGEGKTTMLRILLGIVKAQGNVSLSTEGITLPISPAARRLMAYVPQGNTMMNGTIAENLRMLKPDATDEEIIKALKEACAYEFVKKLQNGIYHNLGESGIGFSEGQNQRLAIARALMCQTPILLLDEATSALDVATERKVLASLIKGQNKRICILTTHRPSVLSMCDRVYRIASQKVREIGTDEIRQIMNEF